MSSRRVGLNQMIVAFLLPLSFAVLGVAMIAIWIVWWLVADIFGGNATARPVRIQSVEETHTPSRTPHRPMISDWDDRP